MHPFQLVALRECERFLSDEERKEQPRIFEAGLDANELPPIPVAHGRIAAARARLHWPSWLVGRSRPVEPGGI